MERILVRHDVSRDLATLLLDDYRRAMEHYAKHPQTVPLTAEEASGFGH